jgi:hypothetical protein
MRQTLILRLQLLKTSGRAFSIRRQDRRLKSLALTAQVAPVLRIIIGVLLPLSISCGNEGGLLVSGTTTPVFEIRRGSSSHVRAFPSLTVVQVHPDNERLAPPQEDASRNQIIWKIAADPKSDDRSIVETIDKIEYGKVPTGFVQEVPQPGIAAPPLQENTVYEVIGPTSLMRNAAVRFKIVDSKVRDLSRP